MQEEDILSPEIVCHDLRSHRGIGSWIQEGNLHIQTNGASRSTVHGYHLRKWKKICFTFQIYYHTLINVIHYLAIIQHSNYLPHIFKGASSSRRIGCERKISLDFKQRPRISFSVSCTFLPGLDPLTVEKKQFLLIKFYLD